MADDAKAKEEKTEEAQAAAPAAAGGKNPLATILMLLNLVAMLGIAFFQYTSMKKMAESPSVQDVIKAEMKNLKDGDEGSKELATKEADNSALEGPTFPLDGFTANLAQGDGPRRFIRLNAVLQFSKDSKENEFKARKPQIRDAIISILNAKRPEDLLKKEGKEYLKEEIKASINSFLVDGQVVDVYYVGFQIN